MIIESIVTTQAFDGAVNLFARRAPVHHPGDDPGAGWGGIDGHHLHLAPGGGVGEDRPAHPLGRARGVILADTAAWREVEVVSIDAAPPRSRIVTRVVHGGSAREFPGFNRARHAVLEAAILATRTHLIPAPELEADLARLRIIVDKTAGPREHEAMTLLERFVERKLAGRTG